MPSKEFANRVLNELVAKGNTAEEVQQKLESLDANQQMEFVNQAATKLGMVEDSPVEAVQEETPGFLEGTVKPIAQGALSGLSSGVISPSNEIVQESPGKVATGELIGGVAQGLMLPASHIANAATGAVSGFNCSQGTLGQKVLGGLLGGATGLVFGAAGKAAGTLMKSLGDAPEKAAQRALGLKAADIVKISAKGRKEVEGSTKEVVKTLKDAGIFSRGAHPEAVEASLKEIRTTTGAKLDSLFEQLDQSGHVIPSEELLDPINKQLVKLKEFPSGFQDEIKKLEAFKADLLLQDTVPASKLRTMTQIVADKTYNAAGEVVNPEALTVWKSLKAATDEIADRVGGSLGQELKDANRTYAATQRVLPAITKKAAEETATPPLRLLSQPIRGSSKLVEDAVQDVLVGSPKWIIDNAAKLGKYAPVLQQAVSRGGQAAAVTFNRLQQQYPDFREKIREVSGDDAK